MSALLISADGQQWELNADEMVVGRAAPAAIILPFAPVSRAHARLTRRDDAFLLEDLSSRNGTFVNGSAVTGTPVRLRNNDEIVLGGAVTLRFYDADATAEGNRVGRLKGVWLDAAAGEVWVDGTKLEPALSAAQYALLERLYATPNQLVTREEIVAAVWREENAQGISEEAIDGLIKRLRARFAQIAPHKKYVVVRRGQGILLAQEKD
jgi:DNA-binding response OmpR family regulator